MLQGVYFCVHLLSMRVSAWPNHDYRCTGYRMCCTTELYCLVNKPWLPVSVDWLWVWKSLWQAYEMCLLFRWGLSLSAVASVRVDATDQQDAPCVCVVLWFEWGLSLSAVTSSECESGCNSPTRCTLCVCVLWFEWELSLSVVTVSDLQTVTSVRVWCVLQEDGMCVLSSFSWKSVCSVFR